MPTKIVTRNICSSQFYKYLSLFSRFRSLAVPSQVARRSLAGVPWAAPLFFPWNNAHSEKVCSRFGKRGSRPGGSPNSLRNNEHSAKALYFL